MFEVRKTKPNEGQAELHQLYKVLFTASVAGTSRGHTSRCSHFAEVQRKLYFALQGKKICHMDLAPCAELCHIMSHLFIFIEIYVSHLLNCKFEFYILLHLHYKKKSCTASIPLCDAELYVSYQMSDHYNE